jgi:hypothetical protein
MSLAHDRPETAETLGLFVTVGRVPPPIRKSPVKCGFSALVKPPHPFYFGLSSKRGMGGAMKRLAVGTAVILAILSLAACAQVGKGKAPPPVVTKG